ncbi:MAG: hypothetical protein FJ241_12505 [Nitrospira sp.]|nr:hypothetical protein [Nitrospira sp.]
MFNSLFAFQPCYQNLGYKKGLCPVAEDFYKREISIPLYQSMSNGECKYLLDTIFKVFKEGKDCRLLTSG